MHEENSSHKPTAAVIKRRCSDFYSFPAAALHFNILLSGQYTVFLVSSLTSEDHALLLFVCSTFSTVDRT